MRADNGLFHGIGETIEGRLIVFIEFLAFDAISCGFRLHIS